MCDRSNIKLAASSDDILNGDNGDIISNDGSFGSIKDPEKSLNTLAYDVSSHATVPSSNENYLTPKKIRSCGFNLKTKQKRRKNNIKKIMKMFHSRIRFFLFRKGTIEENKPKVEIERLSIENSMAIMREVKKLQTQLLT